MLRAVRLACSCIEAVLLLQRHLEMSSVPLPCARLYAAASRGDLPPGLASEVRVDPPPPRPSRLHPPPYATLQPSLRSSQTHARCRAHSSSDRARRARWHTKAAAQSDQFLRALTRPRRQLRLLSGDGRTLPQLCCRCLPLATTGWASRSMHCLGSSSQQRPCCITPRASCSSARARRTPSIVPSESSSPSPRPYSAAPSYASSICCTRRESSTAPVALTVAPKLSLVYRQQKRPSTRR